MYRWEFYSKGQSELDHIPWLITSLSFLQGYLNTYSLPHLRTILSFSRLRLMQESVLDSPFSKKKLLTKCCPTRRQPNFIIGIFIDPMVWFNDNLFRGIRANVTEGSSRGTAVDGDSLNLQITSVQILLKVVGLFSSFSYEIQSKILTLD